MTSGTIEKNETDSGADPVNWGPASLEAERDARREVQQRFAKERSYWHRANRYYYSRIGRLLRFIIEPNKSVLNIRCQTGLYLSAVKPSHGVGVEITEELVEVAKQQHPNFEYYVQDPDRLDVPGVYDYILINDLADTVDVLATLERIRKNCTSQTRVIIYSYNHLWGPLLAWASRIGLRMPQREPNWISQKDLLGILNVSGFEPLKTHWTALCPKRIPVVSWIINSIFGVLPIIERLSLAFMIVARPLAAPVARETTSVSVIIPCLNEQGNVAAAVARIPDFGCETEIIFCDDRSTDGTAETVRQLQHDHPEKNIKLVQGPGICKADNVWTGFRAAKNEMLMILDGDLTVMPEELVYFADLLLSGRAEFANGSRLVYPMQRQAMKWTNYAGNKVFAAIFSFLLGQRVKDTLCGTKVLWRRDWQRIEPLIGSWGVKDRWGDYELLFGASRRYLRIADVPVHYQNRVYGISKMTRVFVNGWNMLKICFVAFRKLKLGY